MMSKNTDKSLIRKTLKPNLWTSFTSAEHRCVLWRSVLLTAAVCMLIRQTGFGVLCALMRLHQHKELLKPRNRSWFKVSAAAAIHCQTNS